MKGTTVNKMFKKWRLEGGYFFIFALRHFLDIDVSTNAFMRQFNYQREKYGMIKGIVWMILHGVTMGWIMLQMPTFVIEEFGSKTEQIIVFFLFFFLWALLSLIFVLMPFGSVIKPISSNEFIMYRRLAWFRWNIERRPIPRQEDIRIVQESDRYYKIVIGFDQGNILALDKFPTLDNATKYLEELRSVLRWAGIDTKNKEAENCSDSYGLE